MTQGAEGTSGTGIVAGNVCSGGETAEHARVSIIRYGPESMTKAFDVDLKELDAVLDPNEITWVTVDGALDQEVVRRVGERFGLHPLVQEDIVSTDHRAKVEDHDDYLFIVLKRLVFDRESKEFRPEQASLILGEGYVIGFFAEGRELFHDLMDRLSSGRGRIRRQKADYLVYALLDVVVDRDFEVVEDIGELLEEIEDELLADPKQETLRRLYLFKRDVMHLRRAIWPMRDVLGWLSRGESELIHPGTIPYLRDVYDHVIHTIESIETSRDTLANLMEIYLSSVSNRMNEVMKVLTVIATIFIPLTFVVGLYGMNFRYMPELDLHWGYPAVLIVMGVIAGGMVLYFRRKNWF